MTRFSKEIVYQNVPKFRATSFLRADDIIYIVSEDVNFTFQFAVQNMLDVILSKLKLLIRLNEVQ